MSHFVYSSSQGEVNIGIEHERTKKLRKLNVTRCNERLGFSSFKLLRLAVHLERKLRPLYEIGGAIQKSPCLFCKQPMRVICKPQSFIFNVNHLTDESVKFRISVRIFKSRQPHICEMHQHQKGHKNAFKNTLCFGPHSEERNSDDSLLSRTEHSSAFSVGGLFTSLLRLLPTCVPPLP